MMLPVRKDVTPIEAALAVRLTSASRPGLPVRKDVAPWKLPEMRYTC
jgi:hypothetical protein